MKKIVNVLTKKEHSGASLLSITLAVLFHNIGVKLCIFTAYPMAKEEFFKQVENPETVFYLESEKDFEKALKFQTIIIQSGNVDLFIKIISNVSMIGNRILFIKNIETINISIFKLVVPYLFIVSGDLDINPLQYEFNNFIYNTKILLSSITGEEIPSLEKYQALMKKGIDNKIIMLSE